MTLFFARSLFSLSLSVVIPLAAAAEPRDLPDLGDESATILSPHQERKLGEDFMRRARQQLDILDDPELNDYIQTLGKKLAAKSPAKNRDFHFFIVNNPTINAFAVPGGYIGIHSGLILASESEGELASVLAHETAHITQRHIPRMIAESQRTSVPAMAALLAAILLASSGHQGGEAAIALTTASLAQRQLNFTRAFEEEADRLGMDILTNAGYDARNMPKFFERLLNLSRLYESDLPEFLRTHPVTTRRISESTNHAEKFPKRPIADETDFYHAQAKIRALTPGSPVDNVRRFKANLDSGRYPHADAEHYGYALSLLGNKQFDAAQTQVNALIKHRPNYVPYWILQAETLMEAGEYVQALARYETAYKKAPNHPALLQRYAAALLQTGQAQKAKTLLRAALRQQPDDPALYKMLGSAAGETGNLMEAHQALAEYYYLNGNLSAALQQLRIASRHAGDNFYYLSSVEARTQAIKDEIAANKD